MSISNLESTLEEYLRGVDALHVVMGEARPRVDEDKEALRKSIENTKTTVDRLLWIISALYIGIYVGAIVLVFFLPMSKEMVGLLTGGGAVGLIGVVKALQSVWREKFEIDLILTVCRGWPPKDAIRLVQQIYESKKKK